MHVLISTPGKDRAVHVSRSVPFESPWILFFAHLPDLRVACGIAIRHRARDSDCDIQAQRGRSGSQYAGADSFVDDFLPHFCPCEISTGRKCGGLQ